MRNVEVPTSESYRDYLIASLRNPGEAAAYIEAILAEPQSEDLLKAALGDVLEALAETALSPEQVKLHQGKLDQLLSQQGSDVVYGLGNWLNALGLRLTVVPNHG